MKRYVLVCRIVSFWSYNCVNFFVYFYQRTKMSTIYQFFIYSWCCVYHEMELFLVFKRTHGHPVPLHVEHSMTPLSESPTWKDTFLLNRLTLLSHIVVDVYPCWVVYVFWLQRPSTNSAYVHLSRPTSKETSGAQRVLSLVRIRLPLQINKEGHSQHDIN